MVRWKERPAVSEPWFTLSGDTERSYVVDPAFDGDRISDALQALTAGSGRTPS